MPYIELIQDNEGRLSISNVPNRSGEYSHEDYFWLGPKVCDHYTGYRKDDFTRDTALVVIADSATDAANQLLTRIFKEIDNSSKLGIEFHDDPRKSENGLAKLVEFLTKDLKSG